MARFLPQSFSTEAVAQIRACLRLLLEGHAYACDLARNPWEFAVEIDELRGRDLSNNAIRWLLAKGLVEHAVEICPRGSRSGRRFRQARQPLAENSCMILSETGVIFARNLEQLPEPCDLEHAAKSNERGSATVPIWNSSARILTIRDSVIKRFKVPAANQELILSAFQEEGWPEYIDDPLPPVQHIDAKRRLHDAINRLNRNQRLHVLAFKGNGDGRAIRWEYISPAIATRLPPVRPLRRDSQQR